MEAIQTALSIAGGQSAKRARALVAAVLAASARFDFHVNDNHNAFVRYSHDGNSSVAPLSGTVNEMGAAGAGPASHRVAVNTPITSKTRREIVSPTFASVAEFYRSDRICSI